MEKTNMEIEASKRILLEKLRNNGCRITKQRKLLVDILLRERCNNCKEIYYLAAKKDPKIGMATVYRMINTLEEMGALKWRNEYTVYENRSPMFRSFQVEFADTTIIELKEESLYAVLEKGLDADGKLKGRKVKKVLLKKE